MNDPKQLTLEGFVSPNVGGEAVDEGDKLTEGTAKAIKSCSDSISLSSLMHKVLHYPPEIVRGLLKEAGNVINERIQDETRSTPLMYVSGMRGKVRVIKLLLEAGANVHTTNINGMTPLLYAAWLNENPDVTRILIAAGARVEDRDNRGSTALIFAAARNKNPEIIEILLDAGADLEAENEQGHTALWYAIRFNPNYFAVGKLLIDAGAQITEEVEKAIKERSFEIEKELLQGSEAVNE